MHLTESIPIFVRFTDMRDGTIRDNHTGLIWLKNANCFGSKYWYNSMSAAASLANGQCGLTDGSAPGDWRLPTKGEWEAFISTVYYNPALVNTVGDAQWSEGDAFTEVQRLYWSSTEESSNHAWNVDMLTGSISYYYKEEETGHMSVWPVRSGND